MEAIYFLALGLGIGHLLWGWERGDKNEYDSTFERSISLLDFTLSQLKKCKTPEEKQQIAEWYEYRLKLIKK
jgi:hypothetical protein